MSYNSLADEPNLLQYHKLYPSDFIYILIVAACSILGINAYQFGEGDQLLYMPMLKQSMDPTLFPNDAWAQQVIPYYYSFLWPSLGTIISYTNLAPEHLFFSSYCVLLVFSCSGLFRLNLLITNDRGASYLALAMFIFSFEILPNLPTINTQIGGYQVALPFVLHGVWLWLAGRPVQGYALLGIACIFHPLSALYGIIFTLPLAFFPFYHRPLGDVILSLFALAFTSSPIWIWRWIHPEPAFDFWFYDPVWLEQIQLTSGSIWNPLQWSWYQLFSVGVALLIVLYCALAVAKSNAFRWFSLALMPLYLFYAFLAILFSNWVPFPAFIQLQLATSIPLVFILSLPSISLFLRNQIFNQGFTTKGLMIIGGLTLLFFPSQIYKGIAFFIITMLVMVYLRNTSSRSYYERTLPLLLAIALSFVAGAGFYFLPAFNLYKNSDMEWQSLQLWAKRNTPKNAIFLHNPNKSGFRAGAERSAWLDWQEGKLGIYSLEYSHTWMSRFKLLEAQSQNQATEAFNKMRFNDFKKIAQKQPENPWFLIVDVDYPEPLVSLTASQHYKVVKLQ